MARREEFSLEENVGMVDQIRIGDHGFAAGGSHPPPAESHAHGRFPTESARRQKPQHGGHEWFEAEEPRAQKDGPVSQEDTDVDGRGSSASPARRSSEARWTVDRRAADREAYANATICSASSAWSNLDSRCSA